MVILVNREYFTMLFDIVKVPSTTEEFRIQYNYGRE
jgi:ribosomal protein S4E